MSVLSDYYNTGLDGRAPRAEDFLAQAYRLDQQIQAKMIQLERIRACAVGTGQRFGNVRVQSSGPQSLVENAVLKVMEEEETINEELARLMDLKKQIREVVERVDDVTYRLVLEKRDLLYESWRKIGMDMNISDRWAQIIHREAVKAVQGVLDRMEWGE